MKRCPKCGLPISEDKFSCGNHWFWPGERWFVWSIVILVVIGLVVEFGT